MATSGEYPLTPPQQQAWLNYMRVYHRLEYEMNRQLQADSGLSLSDYTVMNALSQAPGRRLQLSALARIIGWERSRLSHHLLRMARRDLVDRTASESDGRGTDAVLTATGWRTLKAAAPRHAAWVRRAVFDDLDAEHVTAMADVLGAVYGNLLREGNLPHPDQT